MLNTLIAPALQAAFRGYLRLDPAGAAKLKRISGQLIALRVGGPGIELFIEPTDDSVRVRATAAREPDTTIQGTPAAFLRLRLNRDRANPVQDSGIEISGDPEGGRILHEVLSAVEFDWEGALAERVGDIPAHQAGNVARGLRGWLQETRGAWRRDTREYLTEEIRMAPTRFEVEEFMDAVDVMRSDVDRLEARVRRLESARD